MHDRVHDVDERPANHSRQRDHAALAAQENQPRNQGKRDAEECCKKQPASNPKDATTTEHPISSVNW